MYMHTCESLSGQPILKCKCPFISITPLPKTFQQLLEVKLCSYICIGVITIDVLSWLILTVGHSISLAY